MGRERERDRQTDRKGDRERWREQESNRETGDKGMETKATPLMEGPSTRAVLDFDLNLWDGTHALITQPPYRKAP